MYGSLKIYAGFSVLCKVDDDMLKHYCNEDIFLLEVCQQDGDDVIDVTLIEQ